MKSLSDISMFTKHFMEDIFRFEPVTDFVNHESAHLKTEEARCRYLISFLLKIILNKLITLAMNICDFNFETIHVWFLF